MAILTKRSFTFVDDLACFAAICVFAPQWFAVFALPALAWCFGQSFGRTFALRPDYQARANHFALLLIATAAAFIALNGATGVLAAFVAMSTAALGEDKAAERVQAQHQARRQELKRSIGAAWNRSP